MKARIVFILSTLAAGLSAATLDYASAANGATATSSSVYQLDSATFGPQNAIDGLITPTDYANASTNYKFFSSWGPGQAPHWFEVAFASAGFIETINIYNRSNCCADRLTNFRVSLLNGNTTTFSGDYYTAGGFPNLLHQISNINQVGDRVRVEFLGVPGSRGGEDYLHFDEIQALGDAVPEPSTYAMGVLGLALAVIKRRRQ